MGREALEAALQSARCASGLAASGLIIVIVAAAHQRHFPSQRLLVESREEGTVMRNVTLSEAAHALLRRVLETGRAIVTDDNRESYRELARAGIMYPVSGFISGPEANYRFTDPG